jgi:nitroreductase
VDAYLALVSRREVRDYDARPLPEDAVRRILDAGRLAGSSRNRQQRRFIAVRDPGVRGALAEIVHTPSNVLTAALVVAVVTWGRGPAGLDAGRAAQNMMIAAWNEGIGSCPNGITNADACRTALGAGEEEQVATLVSFGFPARPRDPRRRSPEQWIERADRRPFDEVVEFR